MKFSWKYTKETPQLLRTFIHEQGISKHLLAKIKFQGGKIEVDGSVVNVLYKIKSGEELVITIPDEKEHETLLTDATPIEIVYEDEHFLVVNKPSNVSSIPAQYHPNGTMANRVKHYYKTKNYPNQVIHVVTRLDRDTTGVMLFAKHGFAHALMDKELRNGRVEKVYQALVSGEVERMSEKGSIIAPIARDETSLLKRKVSESGKFAHTEYKVEKKTEQLALVNIRLHTGRTHQIRVHFEHIGNSLIGDEMYHGRMDLGIKRQALHCYKLSFFHPFLKKELVIEQDLAEDMQEIVQKMFPK
ncbi:23S rRNA pseudouridine1911/1915/1917 synthase [Pilibacter termitis]|uniref:Pseudouridine synthase n=1 Tax=Pilibacter termitis TaxID=263852 RepID=A0A1T4KZW5_9ENTE|nr:RluA family pseudouridine synthase [Pilibacter termitis]SJZ47976.1 23S rRNA pseudouridine1911/1915/1917 synthase [Pilibacter termitis]